MPFLWECGVMVGRKNVLQAQFRITYMVDRAKTVQSTDVYEKNKFIPRARMPRSAYRRIEGIAVIST